MSEENREYKYDFIFEDETESSYFIEENVAILSNKEGDGRLRFSYNQTFDTKELEGIIDL